MLDASKVVSTTAMSVGHETCLELVVSKGQTKHKPAIGVTTRPLAGKLTLGYSS